MGASVVAQGDAAPALEAAEHDLDLVALAVEDLVVGQCSAASWHGRDRGGNPGSARPARKRLLS